MRNFRSAGNRPSKTCLHCLGAGTFVTGSGANLLAAVLIGRAIAGPVLFSDRMLAMFPIVVGLMLIGEVMAMKVYFPLKNKERLPQIEGGMEGLKQKLLKMGNHRRRK